jgi:hypothetical protein
MRYALINPNNNTVDNVAEWDGITPWTTPDTAIELAADELCEPWWIYDLNGSPRFFPPTGDHNG